MKENHQCYLKKIIVGRETTQTLKGLAKLLQSTLTHREMCSYFIVHQEYGKQSKDKFSLRYKLCLLPQKWYKNPPCCDRPKTNRLRPIKLYFYLHKTSVYKPVREILAQGLKKVRNFCGRLESYSQGKKPLQLVSEITYIG